ncbi:MAG: DUF4304 domain-containing protein [Cytophagaceae bacterium]
MKSPAEIKFDNILKHGFYETLKPLGFKKQGNNFYRQKDGIGYIINLQKSVFYSKDHIRFTINTGIFLPEFWLEYFKRAKKILPAFPAESECILRKRIGSLRNKKDIWYEVKAKTDEGALTEEMKKNLNKYILSHFGRILTKNALVKILDQEKTESIPLEKLIVFGELGHKGKVKTEFRKLLAEEGKNPVFLDSIQYYGKKYDLL